MDTNDLGGKPGHLWNALSAGTGGWVAIFTHQVELTLQIASPQVV